MAKSKQSQSKEEKQERINTCNICGKPKKVREFYKSTKKEHELFNGGVLPYCKICLQNMCFNENKMFDINKFIEMLQLVDRPFIRELYETALKDKRSTTGAYFSLLSMNDKKDLLWKDSDEEVLNPNDVNNIKMGISKYVTNNSKTNPNPKEEPELDGIELEYLKEKWGEELSIEQLVWMDRNYKRWENDYAISNELDETIIQQIVFEKWYIKQDRQEGKPVDKRIETMNKLIKQGNFKKRSAEDSEINSIAEYIAEWEKGKPFLKESNTPEFKDPDNFIKLGVVLAGAIARTQGKNNKYVEEFEDYYKNVTMDLTNLNNG